MCVMINIEKQTKRMLCAHLGNRRGEERFAMYIDAKRVLDENILDQIRGVMPHYSDHGSRHVTDVMNIAFELLGHDLKKLNGLESYCLLVSILFHDTGNIIDRIDHQRKVSQVYDYVRPVQRGSDDLEEKQIILKICESHCGTGFDGTSDTLKYLDEQKMLDRKSIRLSQLGSILRFADELAEGNQRTSHFMIQTGRFSRESMVFNRYANCSRVNVDRNGGRICLTYHIRLNFEDNGADDLSKTKLDDLPELLNFVYHRIEKLNQERQYARHYCSLLDPFKRVTVAINFWWHDRQMPIDLREVQLSDLVIPGDHAKQFIEYDANYQIPNVVDRIMDAKRALDS